ncbi:DUF5682 family protein [Bailinhaonella thermotolerans]|uniref:Uncharacterized protein n=1 Tax=Bailinhaonella thermotolerans TaxID=1070861 RepID=A0A3A4B1S8_9ACTN|nr:DUF5682 family protein [Bailinhaonella thermotolerans]RJL34128.1 hypothetical protein D5H75_06490 [Bailinhaonella thermotolerans]
MPEKPEIHLLGVRHHGPGSARAVRAALEHLRPGVVLVEGPPEAGPLIPLVAAPGMEPPVALLAYVEGEPSRASFWPFAAFSPEWQALRYAVGAGIPARFCDLPAAVTLAAAAGEAGPDGPGTDPAGPGADALPDVSPDVSPDRGGAGPGPGRAEVRVDPIAVLARTAGYADPERWWDDVIEHRGVPGPSPGGEPRDPGEAAVEVFLAVEEAMTVLREGAPPPSGREARREAAMRKTLRAAVREGFERIAVVCGAWHVPALRARTPAAADDRALAGAPRVRTAVTWVPWTHGRLGAWSGYGAGVASPGWYHHLFTSADRPVERWMTRVAGVLREEGLPVSPAQVIESVRLAHALAALRERPLAGLDEVTEAARAVLCDGSEAAVELVRGRLVVGETLGGVPEATPMVPLQRDLRALARRLRLPREASAREYDLDLRKPYDLERSGLLHRLRLLGVDWGTPLASRGRGTFRERWALAWRPEFDVDLIEAGAFGTTVAAAATARAVDLAGRARSLAELTALAERCLPADLPGALPAVMRAVGERAALDDDVSHLMAALPALVGALRYGDVRATDTAALRTVVDELAVRVCVGLPPAASGLGDDAARELLGRIDAVHAALGLLDDPAHLRRWHAALASLAARPAPHGLIEGRVTRLLLDAAALGPAEAGARMSRAVSPGAPAGHAASWIEGFLSGGALLLVHDPALLRLVDSWLTALPADRFTAVLPLLRRTFATFPVPERRALATRLAALAGPSAPPAPDPYDRARAAPAERTVALILGARDG